MAEPQTPQRPRVGQLVKLYNGQVGEVIDIIKGADCLRIKTEVEVLTLGPTMQAAMGSNWMNAYYEATIMFQSGRIAVVTPKDVERIADQD